MKIKSEPPYVGSYAFSGQERQANLELIVTAVNACFTVAPETFIAAAIWTNWICPVVNRPNSSSGSHSAPTAFRNRASRLTDCRRNLMRWPQKPHELTEGLPPGS